MEDGRMYPDALGTWRSFVESAQHVTVSGSLDVLEMRSCLSASSPWWPLHTTYQGTATLKLYQKKIQSLHSLPLCFFLILVHLAPAKNPSGPWQCDSEMFSVCCPASEGGALGPELPASASVPTCS